MGQPGQKGVRPSSAIQLALYTMRPTSAAAEQIRPPTAQQSAVVTGAQKQALPWSPPIGQPNDSALLVGHLLTLPAAARSWHFAAVPPGGSHVQLTVYNNGATASGVWIEDASGSRRAHLIVPAKHNMEVKSRVWGNTANGALTVVADHPIMVMRSMTLHNFAQVAYGQSSNVTPVR